MQRSHNANGIYTAVKHLSTFERLSRHWALNVPREESIPVQLLIRNLNTFIPIWLELVNISLKEGSIKSAVILPLIKALDNMMDHDVFKNYRPISNLLWGKLLKGLFQFV